MASTSTRTAKATKESVTATVTGPGKIAGASPETLNFGAGGTVTAVYVMAGDTVTEGQAVARIDNTSARIALQQAKAQLLTAAKKQSAADTAAQDKLVAAALAAYKAGTGRPGPEPRARPEAAAPGPLQPRTRSPSAPSSRHRGPRWG
jgi:multidrug efflux pump subunit AcrA (membrane-fusion protein)